MPLLPLRGRGESGRGGGGASFADFEPKDLRGVGIDAMRREREPRVLEEDLLRAREGEGGAGVVERESTSRSECEAEERWWPCCEWRWWL